MDVTLKLDPEVEKGLMARAHEHEIALAHFDVDRINRFLCPKGFGQALDLQRHSATKCRFADAL